MAVSSTSSSSAVSSALASISGVVSGIQTDEIIQKMIEVQSRPVTNLQAQQALLTAKLAAWQDANTRLLAIKTAAVVLTNPFTFRGRTAASSNTELVTATAVSGADIGAYTFRVMSLAQAHQMASQSFADVNSTSVGTGSITIQVGSGAPLLVNIDESNSTLAGVRDAINNANVGVKAFIVNEGPSTSPSYRLFITSSTMGTAGSLSISTSLSGGTGLTLSTVQSASDAVLQFGEGAGAITITKSSNTISDVIPGVTVTLKKADPDAPVTIDVQSDISTAKSAVKTFVDAVNSLTDFVKDQFKYDPETNETGTLFGDYTLASIQSDLMTTLTSVVSGASASMRALSQVGITLDSSGKLVLDETALTNALSNNTADVEKLFSVVGTTTDPGVSFISAGPNTKASPESGYAVQVAQVATRARVTAGIPLAGTLAADEVLTINGTAVNLTAGMTLSQVVSAINAVSSTSGVTASATGANGEGTGQYLTLTSLSYGSLSSVSAVSSQSAYSGGTGIGTIVVTQANPAGETGSGTGAAGQDVQGTINGEPATGSGQMLIGADGNPNTAGLRLLVTAQTVGEHGVVKITRGIADAVDQLLAFVTDTTNGPVQTAQNGLNAQIEDVKREIEEMQSRIDAATERLRKEFTDMEAALGKLQSQGNYLSAQIAAWNSMKK
ncbi:MAG: flagellar filament capping protein FliD [Armatimonadota bacterium]